MRCVYIALIILLLFPSISKADTVIMKDGNRIKGLVVEEYLDRIIFNTIDGEKDILRNNIENIEYDTSEQSFMQLGRSYEERGLYKKASSYYKKAMEINPDYKEAREAYISTHAKSWRQEEKRTKKEMDRQSMVLDWRRNTYKAGRAKSKKDTLTLKDVIGFSLINKEGNFIVDSIRPYSSADKAGIEKGDILAGIWGKFIRYSPTEEVIAQLLGPKYSEVRVLIDKEIVFDASGASGDLYSELGIEMDFEYEGLTVIDLIEGKLGEEKGLKKGDFVIDINNNTTRYIPLNTIKLLINEAKDKLVFNLRRTVNLRREGE